LHRLRREKNEKETIAYFKEGGGATKKLEPGMTKAEIYSGPTSVG